MPRKTVIFIVAIVAVIAGFARGPEAWHNLTRFVNGFHVALPEYQPTKNTVWLNQNWTSEQRNWFYHADQGTRTFGIPYEWFIALEQPKLFPAGGRLSDPPYLDRFGFIPGSTEPSGHDLPIGFAHGGPMPMATGEAWPNPRTKERMTGIGLTCAACHTGRFTYQNTAVIVDGGPALTNLLKMKEAIGLSLFWTRWLPWRFSTFAERVLGPDANLDDKAALKTSLSKSLVNKKIIGTWKTKSKYEASKKAMGGSTP